MSSHETDVWTNRETGKTGYGRSLLAYSLSRLVLGCFAAVGHKYGKMSIIWCLHDPANVQH